MTDSGPTRQDPTPVLDGTLEEHEHCMRLVADLARWLDREPGVVADWSAQVRERLGTLEQAMREHFEGEEQSPLYQDLPTEVPRFADRLDRLRAEHGPILSDISAIVEQTRQTGDPRPDKVRELKARINLLIATMRRHEAEENEIIMSAYWDDLGETD